MKNKFYLLTLAGLLSLGFGLPASNMTEENPIMQSSGTYTIECKGKTYKTTAVEGNIIMPPAKKNIYFLMGTEIKAGEKMVRLDIHFRNQDDFTVGKTYTIGKIDGDDKHPRTMLYSESLPGANEGEEETLITAGSETGTFTLSAMKVTGQNVTLSGRFEFTGRNDINGESVAVKGNFSNVELKYLSSDMYRPR